MPKSASAKNGHPPQPCGPGQICSAGQCQAAGETCRDSCREGATSCVDDRRFQACSRQASGCLDYGSPQLCPDGQRCSEGSGCQDACAGLDSCSQKGKADALEAKSNCARRPPWAAGFGVRFAIAHRDRAEGTQCVDACNPECDLGTQRCADGGVQVCENFNGCPAWSQVNACPQGTACSGNGECRACSAGETDWQDCGLCGFQVRECVNGVWGEWGFCDEFGICRPGAVEVCGNCGTRTCNQACEWSDCENEGPCEAGATEACGECGVRECGAQCNWGACGNSNNNFRDCEECGWEWCCPDGNWCNDCEGSTQQ